jgi:hypothetical protein
MASGRNGKPVTLDDVRDECRMANRLMIARLALDGVPQKDIAAVIGRAESVVSEMFPTGLLRRLSRTRAMSNDKDE